MKIKRLKTNHIDRPLGFLMDEVRLSYVVEDAKGKKQEKAQILVAKDDQFTQLVHDSGVREDINSLEYCLPIRTEPSTRYYWKVKAFSDAGEEAQSQTSWFETPKDQNWKGIWIIPKADKELQMTVYKKILVKKPLRKARMYTVGLGVYELYVDGEKQGEEYLAPGLHDYDSWIQYQTYALSLEPGEHLVELMLGDGWYKGRFGLAKKEENYGDRLACIGDLALWYEDGETEVIGTDTTWKARRNKIVSSGIYPGEFLDDTMDISKTYETEPIGLGTDRLTPRLSPRIIVNERLKPVEIIHTPAGETVLDFGQNMVGWPVFQNNLPKGAKIRMQAGEILQNGNFYRDNLRMAKAEFTYISDGAQKTVRPHFTFYGFRYLKIEGFTGELRAEDFTGWVLHSEMEENGFIETSDPLVNRLFLNARWGQKGNFLDVPTDCPQRDERMGWTGDAQIFSGTACYNMDAYGFYVKFGHDVFCEQKKLGGSVPDVAPAVNVSGDASTAWGEAATVIPYNVYLHYGDRGILERQYASMKAWVDYMRSQDDKYGKKRLWQSGFHYADWLALDGPVEGGVYGATDPFLIASAYYYHSALLVEKAAKALHLQEDAKAYGKLAAEIRDAFIREYFTPAGRLSENTMTAYVVSLYMGLVPEWAYEQTCKGLLRKMEDNQYHLCTGFVGTPYLCQVLSENGMNDIAYRLLMEKGFPGWLYEVLMGATTVWERWNSVLPNGSISGTEMNSLNHYAYGSIVEWMYRYMAGICPAENAPGFKKALIAPKPNYRLAWARACVNTASGRYQVRWDLKDSRLKIAVTIPFDCEALIVLPDADAASVDIIKGTCASFRQEGKSAVVSLPAGAYEFSYATATPYRQIYSIDCLTEELLENEEAKHILEEELFSVYGDIPFGNETPILRDLLNGPFTQMPYEDQKRLDQRLRGIVTG